MKKIHIAPMPVDGEFRCEITDSPREAALRGFQIQGVGDGTVNVTLQMTDGSVEVHEGVTVGRLDA